MVRHDYPANKFRTRAVVVLQNPLNDLSISFHFKVAAAMSLI